MSNSDNSVMCTSMKLVVRGIDMMHPNISHISMKELSKWKEKKDKEVIILDTRPEKEFAVSHMEDAVHIDPDTDPLEVIHSLNIPDESKDLEIVCYCSVGYRSSVMSAKLQSAMKKLNKDSDVRIHNLRGGLFQWATQNLPMKDINNEDTKFVHPYSIVFSRLVDSHLRKWTI